ncbi:MAG: aminoacyl-tRNA deacylase [Nitrospinota bacterium]
MARVKKLTDYLEANGVPYSTGTHAEAFTAQEVAAAQHVPGRMVAKTVVVKTERRFLMAVVPAHRKVDLAHLRALLGEGEVRLAQESEFARLFPECEVGAMPPFGNLFGLDVVADSSLAQNERITFSAGTHRETLTVSYKDFERLEKPRLERLVLEED